MSTTPDPAPTADPDTTSPARTDPAGTEPAGSAAAGTVAPALKAAGAVADAGFAGPRAVATSMTAAAKAAAGAVVDGTDAAAGTDAAGAGDVPRHPFLLYNLARLGLLLVALGISYLLNFRGLALLVLALLVSGAVSLLALRRLRGGAATSIGSTFRRLSERIDKGAAAEDDDD